MFCVLNVSHDQICHPSYFHYAAFKQKQKCMKMVVFALHTQEVARHIGPCARILFPVHMDQLDKLLRVSCSVIVQPLAGQLLHTHCCGPPILGGLVAGG